MSALPKHSNTCEGIKFTSEKVHSEPEHEVSIVQGEAKVMEITSNSSSTDGNHVNLKATKTEMTKEDKMGESGESSHYPEKVMEL